MWNRYRFMRLKPMSKLNVADLVSRGVSLTPAECVALTLAVAQVLDDCRRQGEPATVPPEARILLSSTGHVSFSGCTPPTDETETAQLASLLRRLLRLDERAEGDRRGRVPGALLVVLARALRQIDISPLGPHEFRAALGRFAAPDPAALAAVFWRAAAQCGDDRNRRRSRSIEHREPASARMPAVVVPYRVPRGSRAITARRAGVVAGTLVVLIVGGAGLRERSTGRAPTQSPPPRVATRSAPPHVAGTAPRIIFAPEGGSHRQRAGIAAPLIVRSAAGDTFSPSFSRSGRDVLFHAGRESSAIMRASLERDGRVSGIATVLDDRAANYHAAISPDGATLAFDSDRDGVRGVYLAVSDGASARRISGSGYAAVPTWSPDGGRLAFVRAEPGRPRVWNVWTADVATGALARITHHSFGQPWGASWFPDGRRLAYSREDQLVVIDLDTRRSRVFTSPRERLLVRTPAVSPDGRRIVFQVFRDGVWLLDLATQRMQRVLADRFAEEFVWAPDGHSIAYHTRTGGRWAVWRLWLD